MVVRRSRVRFPSAALFKRVETFDLQGFPLFLFEAPYDQRCMLVTDDKHPGDLIRGGHIDSIIREAVRLGADPIRAIKMGSLRTAEYFGLKKRGAVTPGYRADLVIVNDLTDLQVLQVYKGGVLVAEHGRMVSEHGDDAEGKAGHRADNTNSDEIETYSKENMVWDEDHNLVIAGVTDEDMAAAGNRVIENEGGLAIAVDGKVLMDLPLPIAGLMSDLPVEEVDRRLETMKQLLRELGIHEEIDPFMTLGFVSLPVIPKLSLNTYGTIDVEKQQAVETVYSVL